MPWITVVDRTAADAAAVKAGDLTNTKGWFGVHDLTRFEDNLYTLYYYIYWYDYTSEWWTALDSHKTQLTQEIGGLAPSTGMFNITWTAASFFGEAELTDLYRRVSVLRNTYQMKETTPAMPTTFDGFSYTELNALEQIVQDAYDTFLGKWHSTKRLGAYGNYSGELEGDFRWP